MTGPADGERAAVGGLSAQYRVAAALIYELLWQGRLEFIRLADPNAGRVDDVQIATPGHLDAYQVKWSAQPTSFTFSKLTAPDAEKPALIEQLADGWKKLRGLNPSRHVRVHLLSNDYPSTNDSVSKGTSGRKRISFSNLYVNVLRPLTKGEITVSDVSDPYINVLDQLQRESRLDSASFADFIGCCCFDLTYQLGPDKPTSLEISNENDLSTLASHLQSIVARQPRVVEVTAEELLDELGWTSRVKHHFRHTFFVDEQLYQPIENTKTEVESAVDNLTSGYFALIGGPGTGKSTLLTKTLRYKQNTRVIKYYAYINDDPTQGRGEAHSFLHDLVIELHQQNIGRLRKIPEHTSELRRAFTEQLAHLGQNYQDKGIKTVILVDGLDHIQREQNPERSLILELPLPSQIPAGVLFVLGTQTTELRGISPAISVQLEKREREADMEPLSKQATMRILECLPFHKKMSERQRDRFWEVSSGHPLATTYLIERLRNADSLNAIDSYLESSSIFNEGIDELYEVYWRACEGRPVRDLLGLVCRLRTSIDLDNLIEWCGEDVVEEFYEKTHHFFRKRSESRWAFFHNSFKQFLLEKTILKLGKVDPERDKKFHAKLASYATSGSDDVWQWEAIFHFARAGDWDNVSKIGTQSFFRRQFRSLRPAELIIEDIRLLLEASKKNGDGLLAARAWLIEAEIASRFDNLSEREWETCLPAFLDTDTVMRICVGENRLHIDPESALKIAQDFSQREKVSEARQLFDLAEPLSLLSGISIISMGESIDSLVDWVRLAPRFRKAEIILHGISNIRAEPYPNSHTEDFDDQREVEIQKRLVIELGVAILQLQDDSQWESFKKALKQGESWTSLQDSSVLHFCTQNPTSDFAASQAPALLEKARRPEASTYMRLTVAELILLQSYSKGDVRALLEGINQPDLIRDYVGAGEFKGLNIFWRRIRLNRMLAALGEPVEPKIAVPEPDDRSLNGAMLFERQLVALSNLWGKGLSGQTQDPGVIILQLGTPLKLFYGEGQHLVNDSQRWINWHGYVSAAPDYFKILVKAVAAHGQGALKRLGEEFDRLWSEHDPADFWPITLKREIAKALFRHGDGKDTFIRRLGVIEEQSIDEEDLPERISHYLGQATAWREAGCDDRASLQLDRVLANSFGIFHDKDYQLQTWIGWLLRASEVSTEREVSGDINRFASAVVQAERGGRGRGNQEGASEILRLAWRTSSNHALALDQWLRKRHALKYGSSIQGAIVGALESKILNLDSLLIFAQNLAFVSGLPDRKCVSKALVAKIFDTFSSERANKEIGKLIHCVQTNEYPTERRPWYEGAFEAIREQKGYDRAIERLLKEEPDDSRSTVVDVTLKSGATLSTKQAREQVHDFESFMTFCDEVEDSKFLRWDSLLEAVLPACAEEEVLQIHARMVERERSSLALSRIAERLLQLGSIEGAARIAEDAYKSAERFGWIRHMDGGSKLASSKVLKQAAPDKWGPILLDDLIKDYIQETPYAADFSQSLSNLLEVLGLENRIKDVWDEIRSHIFELFEFSEGFADEVPNFDGSSSDSINRCLISFTFSDLVLPVPELQERCMRTLSLQSLTALGPEIVRQLSDRIRMNPPENRLYISLALMCSRRSEAIRADLKMVLKPFVAADDVAVRRAAACALSGNSHSRPLPRKEGFSLPFVYKVQLKEPYSLEPSVPNSEFKLGEVQHVGENPVDLLSPFVDELGVLSELSEIPIANLLERGVQLMKQVVSRERWDSSAEKQVQAELSALDVKLNYTRPKAEVAGHAVRRIAGELVDAKLLPADVDAALGLSRVFDERLFFLEPNVRPERLEVSQGVGIATPRSEWMIIEEEAFDRFCQRLPETEWVVVGEISRSQILDWGVPTEVRASWVSSSSSTLPSRGASLLEFFNTPGLMRADLYPRIMSEEDLTGLVIYGHEYRLPITNEDWLAFNPCIASAMKWDIDNEVPFGWRKGGKLVAQSVFWKDGPWNRQPPGGDVCAKGWLVLVENNELTNILDFFGSAVRFQRVERSMIADRQRKFESESRKVTL